MPASACQGDVRLKLRKVEDLLLQAVEGLTEIKAMLGTNGPSTRQEDLKTYLERGFPVAKARAQPKAQEMEDYMPPPSPRTRTQLMEELRARRYEESLQSPRPESPARKFRRQR